MRMPADIETAMILRAQAGDEQAKMELVSAYAPAVNAAARAFARLIPSRADAVQAATVGVLKAIADFDPARCARLAGIVRNRIQDELWGLTSASVGAMSVPRTILARYMRVMSDPRVAGNIAAAREIASEYSISGSTVHAVWSSMNNRGLDVEPADREDATAMIEDKMLAELALAAMSPEDRALVRLRYGFDDYSECPLEDAGLQLGLTRGAAYSAHARGLAAARVALGV